MPHLRWVCLGGSGWHRPTSYAGHVVIMHVAGSDVKVLCSMDIPYGIWISPSGPTTMADGNVHICQFLSAAITNQSNCQRFTVNMDFSIGARGPSTADGDVHIPQLCGPVRVVRCTWEMVADLKSVGAECRTVLTAHLARCKGRSPESSATSSQARFPASALAELAAPGYNACAPSCAATWEAGKPISLTLDCLQVTRVDTPRGVGCAWPTHDQSRVELCAMATDLSLGGPTPWGPALRTLDRPRCSAGRVATACREAPLRARGETPQRPRNRAANAAHTACKRGANGMQTDQAHGVGEPDTRHHDGRTT